MLNEEMEQKPYKGKERINKNQTLEQTPNYKKKGKVD